MANVIRELLFLSTELSAQLAEGRGAKVLQNAKTVVIDLNKPKSYSRKLRTIFCPNAKEPKIEVTHNMNAGSSKGISYRFKDGDTSLTGAGITYRENGSVDFNFNIVDSATQVEHISASGSYNPKAKFFDWNNCGETLEHRFGNTIASADSSGFSIRASVNDSSALSVINQIKNFFKKSASALT